MSNVITSPSRARSVAAAVALGAALLTAPASATPGLSHGPMKRDGISASSNWSGYDTTSGPYVSVSSSWIQPSVNCAPTGRKSAYSSFWVGLDGDGSSSVEQTGTDADCSRGTPVYYGWYEMYPAYPVNFRKTVRPGDHLSASATYASGSFNLVLTDQEQHWTQTENLPSSATRLSAEVIAEAPSSGGRVLPLADFGAVSFSSALVDGSAIGGQSPNEIIMVSGSTTKATPSPISGGQNFSVTWNHS